MIDNEDHTDIEDFFKSRKDEGYDGVELVYTDKSKDGYEDRNNSDNEATPESALEITCEKTMQIFDYYVADSKLKEKILDAYEDIKGHDGVDYNQCEAYGNAAQDPPCAAGTEGANRDEAHPEDMDLNPGAVLGTICEYQLAPDKANWNPPGEFRGTRGQDYTLDDEAFNEMKSFLKTYFGISSS